MIQNEGTNQNAVVSAHTQAVLVFSRCPLDLEEEKILSYCVVDETIHYHEVASPELRKVP